MLGIAWRQAVQAEEVTVLSDAIEAKQAKVLVQKFELKSHKSLQINERFLLACEEHGWPVGPATI